ncbi:MAG: hypothetical protein HZB66_02665 [Candidatus Aenigmarchaeota archaeon]|nr:hypothetical protein [Candidatus Aenigmarchaeota archaeon]
MVRAVMRLAGKPLSYITEGILNAVHLGFENYGLKKDDRKTAEYKEIRQEVERGYRDELAIVSEILDVSTLLGFSYADIAIDMAAAGHAVYKFSKMHEGRNPWIKTAQACAFLIPELIPVLDLLPNVYGYVDRCIEEESDRRYFDLYKLG